MQFNFVALLPIAFAAVASSAPVSVENRGFGDFVSDHINGIQDIAVGTVGGLAGAVGGPAGIVEGAGAGVALSNTIQSHTRRSDADAAPAERGFGDFVSDHINGIQDIAAGTVGGLAGAVGGPAGIVEGAGAGVTLSNTIQSHTRRAAADATIEAIKRLERREDLTPAERGIIDFVKDHSNGIQDIAYGTVGGLAGLEGGPVGVATGVSAGVGISDSLQNRRGLIDYAKDHANGLEDIAAGTAGGIAGAVYGGPIGAVTGVSGGVKASDELQGRDGAAHVYHGIDQIIPFVPSPSLLAPAALKTPTSLQARRIPEAALDDTKISIPEKYLVKPALPTLVGGPARFTPVRVPQALKTPVVQAQA